MLTVFSIPKAFVGHIAVIQRNALGSWIRLGEGIQVILFGDDEGVAEAAREAGAEHVAEIDRNEYGTPLLNSAFSTAARMGRNPLLCYVNGDMMFTDELTRAAALIRKRNFLMVGHRWNVDITEPWDFSDPQWRKKLVAFTRDHGVRDIDYAIDYFVFPRHSKLTIQPPFAIGRSKWDNYLLFRCRQLGYPLINATAVITAVHQNHDYAHLPNGNPCIFGGPEADANKKLLGGEVRTFALFDATHRLTEFGLKKTRILPGWSRRELAAFHPRLLAALHPRILKAIVAIKKILRRLGFLQTRR